VVVVMVVVVVSSPLPTEASSCASPLQGVLMPLSQHIQLRVTQGLQTQAQHMTDANCQGRCSWAHLLHGKPRTEGAEDLSAPLPISSMPAASMKALPCSACSPESHLLLAHSEITQ
jgi:hypothetical protein